MGILAGIGGLAHAAWYFGRSVSGLALLLCAGGRAFHLPCHRSSWCGGCPNEK